MVDRSREETRDRFGMTLIDLARKYNNVVAMDCDLGRSTRSYRITEADPNRFLDMGIAEQNLISTAAGMALMGKVVFVNSFAIFLTGRAFDQIRQQVSLPRLNVKICGSSAGITLGADGATHQSVVDVALMRSLPNMTVLVPADGDQTEQAVWSAYHHAGPVYLRLSRYPGGNFLPANTEFSIGKARIIREGKKIALISCGPVMKHVMGAADLLAAKSTHVGIVNFPTIKPFDQTMLARIAEEYELLVSVEEHSIYGGLGSAAAECLAELRGAQKRASLVRLGVQDAYGESGSADELLKKHGLDPEGIAAAVLQLER
jgi:transketolase